MAGNSASAANMLISKFRQLVAIPQDNGRGCTKTQRDSYSISKRGNKYPGQIRRPTPALNCRRQTPNPISEDQNSRMAYRQHKRPGPALHGQPGSGDRRKRPHERTRERAPRGRQRRSRLGVLSITVRS